MAATVFVLLAAFFILFGLLGLLIYQLMCLSDLELDYVNPYDSASRINAVVVPEFALHGFLSLIFLFSGHWLMFLFCVPILCYNVRLYHQKQHLVDVTEIFSQLGREKMRRLIKLAGFIILLFLSLFWLIWTVLEED
ncbi:unnamed protein product [Spirodela intermedia]|uniref:Uncharacterized protein n=2 Tax=Spirodela intermedia TaxID=51605 RepID=A0A7I8L0T2_SPIIN|nr:unnamed protein product [Spirodela intermedia]CAA6666852.1 unnamed protein product [Spirodela intermedia]CAA7403657.1 unnamed protein product [Spirodela intermedia]